jgi:hypothetical protein
MINRSTWFFISCIWFLSADASLLQIEAAMTALLTPQARPRAFLEGTKTYHMSATVHLLSAVVLTYGTFLSSASNGIWSKMAKGDVSAARTTRRLSATHEWRALGVGKLTYLRYASIQCLSGLGASQFP